ncbi:uncharacterized protein [Antedon mediterranea]|uniref:uncharacterized protein n=1 Tax=Antedon mediterranea TaxID=105859 RepID=UPI003AF575E4
MDEKGVAYLKGYAESFQRSFNMRVLADDTEIKEAYKTAQEKGKVPFNRTKVLILGDHGAGKTSTCRRLQGKDFRPEEPSTIGIETNTVQAKVSDVNSKWCEVTSTPLEDYESSAAWWTVSRVLKQSKNKVSNSRGRSKNNPQVLMQKLLEDTCYLMLYIVPFMTILCFGGFTFGFGPVVWLYIVCVMSICDVHSAYRFGCGYAIFMVILDSATQLNEHFLNLQSIESIWMYVSAVIDVCIYGVGSFLIGVLMSTGGRTGICVALCFMVHPNKTDISIESFFKKLSFLYNILYYFKFVFSAVIIIVIFRSINTHIFSLSRRKLIILLMINIICIITAIYLGRNNFVEICILFCFIAIVFSIMCGVILGRKMVAYGYTPGNYILKKSTGFIVGICLAEVCGWRFGNVFNLRDGHNHSNSQYIFDLILFYAPITGFFIYEILSYVKVKTTSSIPIVHIRNSMKADLRNECYIDARLSLWDFAGQDMYYNTHHLFMPKQGVYLVVFNAVEAISNPHRHIKRLQFWLQSIAMHVDIENAVVFLVGTRRGSVRDEKAFSTFERCVNAHLYKRFSKLLAFHPSGRLCFFIENSFNVDTELNILRQNIYNEIIKFKYVCEMFYVKYLLFKETLNGFRHRNFIIVSIKEIEDELMLTASTIFVKFEVRQLLNFFEKSGDIIYNEFDELLQNYVVCDPQILIDILKLLVNVPEPHKRNRALSDLWQRLQETGIVDSRLLEHICRMKGIWRVYPYVIRYLVGTQLMFPLTITNQVDQVGTFCLPCKLPKIDLQQREFEYIDCTSDIFYFDFGEMLLEFVFLRLIAKCCQVFDWNNIYYNCARFRASDTCFFQINTDTVSSGSIFFYDRNLIKLSVSKEIPSQSVNILQTILNSIEGIIEQTFNPDYFHDQYICGPVCERCSSLDGTMCLVNLITLSNDVSALNEYRVDAHHKVYRKPEFSFTCSRPITTRQVAI